jgi:hypothetical protein
MALMRGFITLAFYTGFFALSGALVAMGLNWLAPGYYPGVFPAANRWGEAAEVGLGIGVEQGLMLGLLVGVALAIGLGWFGQLALVPSTRAFAVVALCATVFAGGGTLVGYLVGLFAPGYYRAVLSGGGQPDFNPIDVGIGLGCSQGLMLGVVVGAVVAVVVAWRLARKEAHLRALSEDCAT